MKQILLFCLILIALVLAGVKSNTQTNSMSELKLNNAFNHSTCIVIDSKGNAFVTGRNNKIIKINSRGKAEIFAGGGKNNKDGIGKEFSFSNIGGIAIDSLDNLYVTDNTGIRKVAPDGKVSSVAGTAIPESKDGNKTTGSFLHPENIAIDYAGNIYVTDYAPGKDWTPGRVTNSGEYYIRKITAKGVVTTIQNSNAEKLIFKYPRGLACDKDGNLLVCASVSHCIKKITPDGTIITFAGQCDKTIFHSVYKEGNMNTAVLTNPTGIAIEKNGDVYISDDRMNRIIKIANNKVTTVAGSGEISFSGNIAGASETGETDGTALQAKFFTPWGIAFDKAGDLFIVDGSSRNNSYIRKLSTNGIVSTFCKHTWNEKSQQFEEGD